MDNVDSETRSKIMRSVTSSGNKSTEVKIISIFREMRIIGWRRKYDLFGKPDFVFPRERVAVFVDGCFWHGCKKHCRIPKSNNIYWVNKIEKSVIRDRVVTSKLESMGWHVIRIWEHELNEKSLVVGKLEIFGIFGEGRNVEMRNRMQ